MRIRKWVGVFLNGRGDPDIQIVDHNPGHLAHTFLTEFDVPDDAIACLQKRMPCVVIDKFGNPTGVCSSKTRSS